jgi:hypothetical protein
MHPSRPAGIPISRIEEFGYAMYVRDWKRPHLEANRMFAGTAD